MIPKKIHYCWLSNDKFPPLIERCISSWKEKLTDYEFILWDTNRFDLNTNVWVKQAFEAKKYAFAADYIRLYALYHYGGIYLDSDIEVIKKFDDLLHLPYFIGTEGESVVEAGVFGAEKGCAWISDCLPYYDGRHFIKEDGNLDTLPLPQIMMSQISKDMQINEANKNEILHLSGNEYLKNLYMFPKSFFCAKNHGTGEIEQTIDTYCIHHFAMSWVPKGRILLPRIKRFMMKVFGVRNINGFIGFLKLKEIRRRLFPKKYA